MSVSSNILSASSRRMKTYLNFFHIITKTIYPRHQQWRLYNLNWYIVWKTKLNSTGLRVWYSKAYWKCQLVRNMLAINACNPSMHPSQNHNCRRQYHFAFAFISRSPFQSATHIIAVQTAQLTRNSRKDMERRTAHSPLICLDIFRLF